MKLIFESWRKFIEEGGAKSLKTRDVELNPQIVKEAIAMYVKVLNDWNVFLQSKGKQPVRPVQPVGSVAYYEKDLETSPGTLYGDVDYLVEFPYPESDISDTERRKVENSVKREYSNLMIDFLKSPSAPKEVDVEETVKENSDPMMLIMQVREDAYVQVDTIVTYPKYSDWMSGRYVPQHGIKGYATGLLLKTLGDIFTLTIGTEGVLARIRDGERVSGGVRKGVEIKSVSTDIRNFFVDIAQYLGANEIDPLLQQYSGIDPKNVSITDMSKGIRGLAKTLGDIGYIGEEEMVSMMKTNYAQNLEDNTTKKIASVRKKGEESFADEKEAKMKKVNKQAYDLFLAGIE